MTKDPAAETACPIPVVRNDLPDPYPTLGAAEVHVWHANLDRHAPDALLSLLTADEVSRADRFHFAKDRAHYIVARGLLRKLLAGYLCTGPADLRFAYAEKGKPALAESQRGLLKFNLAHANGRAIYVFSIGRELGVDLEFIRADLTGEKLAERFFSPAEIAALRAVPPELRQHAFFACWTRKEAYLKARGDGLSLPLDAFDVSLAPGEPAALLKNNTDAGEVARWEMQAIPVTAGYVAALVVEGHGWRLKTFRVGKLAD